MGGKPSDSAAHAAVTARSRRSHDQRVLRTVSAPHSEKKMAAVAEEVATSPRAVRQSAATLRSSLLWNFHFRSQLLQPLEKYTCLKNITTRIFGITWNPFLP